YKLPESIRKHAKLIDEKLAGIKVCDPAIGSGAFPVGMMHEIVKTRNVLSVYISLSADEMSISNKGLQPLVTQESNRTIYNFKRQCIEKSLYGVDIDPGAVEIAKLRLWLSLVVDEEDIKKIKPLPNLDYKIVCGNSLLGVEKNLFNNQLFAELERLKPIYFDETNPTKKQEYKQQIDELISRITDGHKEFDFEVYFSEVFHDKIIEKNWSLYHITWVTHNSRVSERMIEYEAIIHLARINKGLPAIAEPTVLNENQEVTVTRSIAEIVREDKLRILAYNICRDHVHLALVCEERDRDNIVRKLKGKSAQKYKETYKIEEEFHLWAQKYSWTLIESEEQLENTVNYIKYNRQKHHLPDNKGLQPLVAKMLTSFDQAMQPVVEKGGFDVVIGNPPYGFRNVLSAEEKKFFRKIMRIEFPTGDIAELFILITLGKCVRNNGALTYIIPKKSLYGESWKNVRKVWLNNDLDFLMDASQTFENVLLEQVAFSIQKRYPVVQSIAVAALDSNSNTVRVFGRFPRRDIFTSDLSNAQIYRGLYEKSLLKKIFKQASPDTATLIKAVIGISNITSHLTFESQNNYPCVKGIDIIRYGLKQDIRYVKGEIAKQYIGDYQDEKIVAQKIIAHIQNPMPHILITMFLDNEKRLVNDTCVEIKVLDEKLKKKFMLAYFQSSFCNWYAYNFVYNRAIRTMDFINYYVTQIPIPHCITENPKQQQPFIDIVDSILAITKNKDYLQNPQKQAQVKRLEREIDRMVYKLYGLTEEEIRIVEEGTK
ncbi:MAG: hypothetical protein DRP89_07750, partial [Candidatus Neomarinimicrobiota bacterium]